MNPRIQTRAAETTADPRWAQVLARAPAADGHFVYSVRSTGVFCRPSCGARSPRPENVAFHASAADAQAAGFRPCRRCRPDQPPLAEQHAARIAELCRFIENAEAPPSLAELAARAGLSRHHLHRVFKAITGLTPRDYAAAHRARRLRDELGRSASITDAILDAGYPSTGRFYAHSTEVLGMTPTTWRAGGADTDIRFAIGQSTLGAILVAASPRGVCAIALGDDPEQLARDLQNRFPHARLIGAERDFEDWVARVVGFVEAPGSGLELPLDIRGTAFQQRVWQALRAIPPGTTLSYTELARRLGVPQSCRAVASACAANPLALVIPCHRVVRSDGGLAGYRWGVERKGELIKREAGQ
ncbi:MAG: bifunctional DNA-binding transcriptional regulator/O6-methylguanine-DNA methyltransferase Ada [Zoogloea sp.]|nr:bifunctional DNA-binding transcriptional regulator/O6-methylguanine-DNA methyltransferase Ada [Zoogloea sp.]